MDKTVGIYILGNGQLGNALYNFLIKLEANVVLGTTRIYDDTHAVANHIFKFSKSYTKTIVINTIAKTDTRYCEENSFASLRSNAFIPIQIANHLKDIDNILFVHISTGCIYNGNYKGFSGYTEHDPPLPLITYAKHKLIGESFKEIKKEHIIIRPRMLFSADHIKSNLVYKVDGFSELLDEQNSMTSINTLLLSVRAIIDLYSNDNLIFGIYHLCNTGTISPLKIKEIMEIKRHEVLGTKKLYTKIDKTSLIQKIRETYNLPQSFRLTDTIIDSSKIQENIFDKCNMKIPDIMIEINKSIEQYFWK